MGRSKHNKRRSSGKAYKDLRLCGQVAKALNYALAGECDDDILRDLYVESVLPAPDSSRMLVTVMPNSLPATSAEILERLHLHMNTLMLEVAAAIHRRKAPQLKFNVLSRQSLDGISGDVSEDDLYDDDTYDESLSEY